MVEIIRLFNNIISLMDVKEFRLRFISTSVMSILFLLLFLLGDPFVSIFFCLLFSFIFFEYEKLTVKILENFQVFKILLLQTILLFFTVFEIFKIEIIYSLFNNYITFLFISIFFNAICLLYKKTIVINFILSNLIIFSFFSLIGILQSTNGLYMILYVVILISTMDISAYFGGKLFGSRKIIPTISKGKTVEGTIIGLLSTILISFFIKDLVNFNVINSLIYGFFTGIFAFCGDLLESIFKRNLGIKDSGKLIPGHGGLMDRFDSYFLAIPFFYISIN